MKVAGLLFAALFIAAPALAQSPPGSGIPQVPTFTSGADLVALNVTVQDHASRFVTGLRADDFVVREDGVKQDVRFFESSNVPVDLIVLLDTSASMGDKMDVAHDAACGFLRTLRPGDRGAVVGFSDSVSVLQPFTGDTDALLKAVRATHPHGSTSLYNAVYIALRTFGQQVRRTGDVRRQAIVVLSDGADTASLISFDDVSQLARRMGVSIYTVSVQSRYDAAHAGDNGRRFESEADYAMKSLARDTGGAWFSPVPSALKAVYASIADELAHQYSIGYVPVSAGNDGQFHRVTVQVVTRANVQSRTRLGYLAAGAAAATSYDDSQR